MRAYPSLARDWATGGLLLQVTFTLTRSTKHQSSNGDTQINFVPSVVRQSLLLAPNISSGEFRMWLSLQSP